MRGIFTFHLIRPPSQVGRDKTNCHNGFCFYHFYGSWPIQSSAIPDTLLRQVHTKRQGPEMASVQ